MEIEREGQPGTALPGSDPGQGQLPDPPTGADGAKSTDPPAVELDDDGKPLPFNEHPKWKSARQSERALTKLLEENELDSIEDLVELVNSGKAITGKGIDPDDLDSLISKATEMDQVKEYWEQQRELQKRSQETPDETAERLARENEDLKRRLSGKDEIDSSKKVLEGFEKKSLSFIEANAKDMDKEDREAVAFLMGVGHPFAEIDIGNEQQIKKMGKQVLKVVEGIEQRAIKKYVDGKKGILKIGSTATPAAPAAKGVMNLRDARAALRDQLRNVINH